MKKLYILATVLGISLALYGCGSTSVDLPVSTDSTFSLGQTYTIGSQETSQQNVYGVVVGDNLKNVFSDIGGFITSINCQPGKKVTVDTTIASIMPNQNDPAIKNLYIQKASLEAQLANLQSTYDMTEQNFEIQQQTLSAQIENTQNTYDQNSADLQKLEDSIQNFKNQQEIVINDALKKVNDNGGNARNLGLYYDLYNQNNNGQNMSDQNFSQYLATMANLMEEASKYASGDTHYSMFVGLSNGFWTSKSTFDGLVDSYASAQNAYNTQHNTLGLTISLADEQAQTIENNKQIQLNALDNQMQTIQQTLDSLSNSLEDEDIYAGVDGVVKAKVIGDDNKISANAVICQIIPNDSNNKKIQIFSANKIGIGQIVKLYNGDTLLGAEKIQYELPYRDPATQNYIYEITDPNLPINEGDRLTIQFFKKLDVTETWIPVSFVFSKLDGNYIRIQNGSGFIETKVDLGDINGDLVKVNSGANLGQTIVN